jgi:predicted metal-dependent hydrolase
VLQLTLDFFGRQASRLKRALPPRQPARSRVDHLVAWNHGLTVQVVFPPRARRYLLSLRDDGTARLAIPRRGTEAEGLRFLERSEAWLLRRVAQWRQRSNARQPWVDGSRFLFRGEEVALRIENVNRDVRLSFADQAFVVPGKLPDYREAISAHLRQLAERELPQRTRELAAQHNITVKRITVRAQKTRWGSCSVRGTISLNWKLIQSPAYVVDYLIVHELMHRREMNHSRRYWKLVAEAFPDYRRAEAWLKSRQLELRP